MTDKFLPTKRTSSAQLLWTVRMLALFFKGLGRHVQKFGLIYGFVLGSLATLCFLALFTWYVVLEYPAPWKITDAMNPGFDPAKFEFTDYGQRRKLQETLNTLFPPGTDKAYVDEILGNVGKAKVTRFEHKHPSKKHIIEYRYSYNQTIRNAITKSLPVPVNRHWPSHLVSIVYDENMKLKKILVLSSR